MRANEVSQIEEFKKLEVEFENRTKDNRELIEEKEEKIKSIGNNYENVKGQLDDVLKEHSDIEETNSLYRGKFIFTFFFLLKKYKKQQTNQSV